MSLQLTIYNAITSLLPYRGFFSFRRCFLRICGVSVGANARIAPGARFYDRFIAIGEDSWIGPECTVFSCSDGPVRIGHRVDAGPGCMLISGSNHIGESVRRAGPGTGNPIVVGAGTWLGARCTVLAGAEIGVSSVVAAGSVVVAGKYPDNSLIAGVPAAVKRSL